MVSDGQPIRNVTSDYSHQLTAASWASRAPTPRPREQGWGPRGVQEARNWSGAMGGRAHWQPTAAQSALALCTRGAGAESGNDPSWPRVHVLRCGT